MAGASKKFEDSNIRSLVSQAFHLQVRTSSIEIFDSKTFGSLADRIKLWKFWQFDRYKQREQFGTANFKNLLKNCRCFKIVPRFRSRFRSFQCGSNIAKLVRDWKFNFSSLKCLEDSRNIQWVHVVKLTGLKIWSPNMKILNLKTSQWKVLNADTYHWSWESDRSWSARWSDIPLFWSEGDEWLEKWICNRFIIRHCHCIGHRLRINDLA